MINIIPIIGWLLSLALNASMAVPFWVIWTWSGLGARYFYWLPAVYLDIPFWHTVGLFIVIGILKSVLIPALATVKQENK